jgi:hypothetical protein
MSDAGYVTSPPLVELPFFGLTNSDRSGILVARLEHKEGIMTCTRCQGYMAKDHFWDLMESAEDMWLAGGVASTADTSLTLWWSVIDVGRGWPQASQLYESQSRRNPGTFQCHRRLRGFIRLVMRESPCEWERWRPTSEAVSKVFVYFPMFSCHVVEAGLDFL